MKVEIDLEDLKVEYEKIRMRICVSGFVNNAETKKQRKLCGEEISRILGVGREAFLKGDMITVAQMFSVLQ